MKLFRFCSTFIKWCILTVAITSNSVTGQVEDVFLKQDFDNRLNPNLEPSVYAQIQLEESVNNQELSSSPENDGNIEPSDIADDPNVQEAINECNKGKPQPKCKKSKYRTYDGTCNNLKHPLWGSSNYMLDRVLPAEYEGASGLRKSVGGGDLPNPRDISIKLIDRDNPTKQVSALFTFFGQVIAHDVSLTPVVTRDGKRINCCSPEEDGNPSCANVYFSKDDPFYKKFNLTCFPFTRTAPYPKCNLGKRNPMNKQTSFMDASLVYGYNQGLADRLRTKDGSGKFRSQDTENGELLPPNVLQSPIFCPNEPKTDCFEAGDERVNMHAMLTTMHTVFMRFHNTIADQLHEMNPIWDDERLYQEARKLVIAVYQQIVYKEYMPWVVKSEHMNSLQLSVDDESLYNDEVNPTGLAEFATGSFRLHSMVPKAVSKFNPETRFDETYSNPQLLLDGKTESLVAGSCEVPSEKNDRYVKVDVSNYLYRPPGGKYGGDLVTADIQRGREHGLPRFVDAVSFCSGGNIEINDFSDLTQIMSTSNAKLLHSIYENVADIDLQIGIYLEKVYGKIVTGNTASCLTAIQFYRSKFGDSFFFTHTNGRNPFTDEQLKSIRDYSFAQLICQSGCFTSIRKYPLLLPSDDNDIVDCKSASAFDLTPWTDTSARDDSPPKTDHSTSSKTCFFSFCF